MTVPTNSTSCNVPFEIKVLLYIPQNWYCRKLQLLLLHKIRRYRCYADSLFFCSTRMQFFCIGGVFFSNSSSIFLTVLHEFLISAKRSSPHKKSDSFLVKIDGIRIYETQIDCVFLKLHDDWLEVNKFIHASTIFFGTILFLYWILWIIKH